MTEISIIIVNYNTTDEISNCIRSLLKYCKKESFEIIIVDNNSIDRSYNKFKHLDDRIQIINNTNNIGFGRANNIGAKHAKGEFLFFLNPDTIFIEDSLSKLIKFYKDNENKLSLGIIGTQLVSKNMKINNSGGDFPKCFKEIEIHCKRLLKKHKEINYQKKYNDSENFIKIDYVSGADMFIKKNKFWEVKGFNKNFFMFFEETDLQYRLNKKFGYKSYIIRSTKIIHLEDGSTKKIQKCSHWKRMIFKDSKVKYLKYNDSIAFPIYYLFLIFFGIVSLVNRKYTIKENIEFYKIGLF
ncbi:MAG: glycosyltransferase family 2 protein [Clostridia bacterium]